MQFEYRTDRLILKILTTDAFKEVLDFQIRNRDIFEKYEPLRPANFYTPSYQHSLLKYEHKLALKLSTVRFYVFRKEDLHLIIGTVCLHNIMREPYSCCEIGYKFDSSYWHMGYAKEALEKIISVAFFELNLHRIFARVVPWNTASLRLLSALHFMEEGLEHKCIQIQGEWTDHLRLALLTPLENNASKPTAALPRP
ncbi:MAG: GNAT family protein [Clostridiales bacterium]|nr:GNAT family protein [Clostridiales bacterium]